MSGAQPPADGAPGALGGAIGPEGRRILTDGRWAHIIAGHKNEWALAPSASDGSSASGYMRR